MVIADKRRFGEMIAGLCANYRQEASKELLTVFWAALEPYDIDVVSRAMNAHIRSSKWMPTVAEVIALADVIRGDASVRHPAANEAWSIAMLASDESETVVWTPQMRQAWFACQPVMEAGDKVGARMAFLATYERLVQEAEAKGIQPRWETTLGASPELREQRVEEAVRLGRLPAYALEPYRCDGAAITFDALAAKAIAHSGPDGEALRKRWAGLRESLSGKAAWTDADDRQAVERELSARPVLNARRGDKTGTSDA